MNNKEGFTLIEMMVVVFVVGTIITGVMGLFILNMRTSRDAERRIAAVALANERMERVRNLPYAQVGTVGGVPSGAIAQSEDVVREGVTYSILVDVRYVDDDFDGTDSPGTIREEEENITICHHPPGNTVSQHTMVIGGSALDAHLAHGDTIGECGSSGGDGSGSGDSYNADFKQVRIQVSWSSPSSVSPVMLITYVAPQGIEGGDAGGTLDFQALNASGVGVEGADVNIINNSMDPAININTQTNSEGHVVLPGMPVSADAYEISVSKSGYSSEQTYDATDTFIPDADHSHLSLVAQQVTVKTFFIDVTANLNVTTQDAAGVAIASVAYHLRGTKTIGDDISGTEAQDVYAVDEDTATGVGGSYTHSGLVWDQYELTIDGIATGYDIKETSTVMPFSLTPGETLDLAVTLVEHTPFSLHVTAVDADGLPVDNTTVRVTGPSSYDETQGTGVPGQVLFGDLPESGSYFVELDAPGFAPVSQNVEVSGTSRVTVSLTPAV